MRSGAQAHGVDAFSTKEPSALATEAAAIERVPTAARNYSLATAAPAPLDSEPDLVPQRVTTDRRSAEILREGGTVTGSRSERWNGEVSTREQQQRAKRQLLLREAGRAFSERGFHNTTLDDVAANLGISKTIFYHYFRGKNDVLKACVEVGFEIADRSLERVAKTKLSGLEKVTEFIRLYVEGITSEIGACAVVLEMRSLAIDDYKALLIRQRSFDRKLRSLVQGGIEDGSIGASDATVAVGWIMGGPTVLARWYRPDGRLSAQDIATLYAEFARRSLKK